LVPGGWGLVGEGALAVGFGACCRNSKETGICRGPKRARGGIDLEKIREICWTGLIKISKAECGDLILNSLLNRKPVKGLKERSYMVIFGRAKDETGGMILHTLKPIDDVVGGTRKEGVAIIKTGKNKGTEQSFGGILSEEVTDGGDAADFKETSATNVSDMLLEGERLVKSDSKIADSRRKSDRRTIQINRRGNSRMVKEFFGSEENHFSFIFVKLQPVKIHPCLQVGDARLSRGNEVRKVRDRSREIELIIIRETVVRKRVMGNDGRDRMSVKNEQNGPQDRALGNAILQGRGIG
jgi:hypothetical protein